MYVSYIIDIFMCCRAFKDIKGADSDTYSYNPCYAFTEGSCKDVAVSSNVIKITSLSM